MMQYLAIHAKNPQPRLIQQALQILQQGGVVACPTDSSYALVCLMGFKEAHSRIRRIRHVDDSHPFTLVCRDLADIGTYAKVNNTQFRLLKARTPGAYTFLLEASREVPRRLQHPKRSTIGIRVPDHIVTQSLLEALGEPLLSMTLQLPGELAPMSVAWEIHEVLEHQIDAVIDSDIVHVGSTTVLDLTEEPPLLVRAGVAPWP